MGIPELYKSCEGWARYGFTQWHSRTLPFLLQPLWEWHQGLAIRIFALPHHGMDHNRIINPNIVAYM